MRVLSANRRKVIPGRELLLSSEEAGGEMDRLGNASSEMRWMPLLYGVTAGLSCLVIVQLLVMLLLPPFICPPVDWLSPSLTSSVHC